MNAIGLNARIAEFTGLEEIDESSGLPPGRSSASIVTTQRFARNICGELIEHRDHMSTETLLPAET